MDCSDFQTLTKYARRLNDLSGEKRLPALVFMTDRHRMANPLAVIARLEADCAVIFRDYDAPDRAELGATLATACRERGVRFLVAGDGALAELLQADGLHMPEGRMGEVRHWRQAHPDWLLTAAVHSGPALEQAAMAGADAALLSPVFPTASHPETHESAGTLGPHVFNALSDQSALPVYALGGITADTALLIGGRHTAGIAAIGAFQTLSPD